MKTRDAQLLVHVAAPLKTAIEALAKSEGRSVSNYVCRLLVEHAAKRVVELGHVA
jgi:hypothetical protein